MDKAVQQEILDESGARSAAGETPAEYLERYRAVAGHGLADDTPVVAWLVKGLVGGINLLAGFLQHGRTLSDHWLEVLRQEHDRLGKLISGDQPDTK